MSDDRPKEERRPDRAAFLIAILLAGLAAVVAVDTYRMPSGVASYSQVGPRAFPYVIAACLALIAVVTAVEAWRSDFPERHHDDYRPMAWIVGGLILQIALLPYVGFALASGAVFAATARAFGRRQLWFTYPLGVVFALAIWLAFAQALNLILPMGDLERIALDQLRALIAMLRGNG